MIPGHESVGIVHQLGEGVEGFAIGDHVGLSVFRDSCGKVDYPSPHLILNLEIGACIECKSGLINYCPEIELAGLNSNGGMGEFILADPKTTVKFPDALFHCPPNMNPLDLSEQKAFSQLAPFMCSGSTAFNSLLRAAKTLEFIEKMYGIQFNTPTAWGEDKNTRWAQIGKGRSVGIIGVGGVGHLAVQFAKHLGFVCVGVDMKEDVFQTIPADLRPDVQTNPTDAKRSVTTFCPRGGVDAVLVCASSNEAYKLAAEIVVTHGVIVAVGQPPREGEITFHWRTFVAKDVTVVPGCLGDKKAVEEMMELVVESWKSEKSPVRASVKEYKMEEVEEMIRVMKSGEAKGKYVVRID